MPGLRPWDHLWHRFSSRVILQQHRKEQNLPTYPAPTTHTCLIDCGLNWDSSADTLGWISWTSLRSSISEGRKSGLELGVVGLVEQEWLVSDGEEKTSIGISSYDIVDNTIGVQQSTSNGGRP